jgi:cytochrome b6-f complex iron-sulfur subunit
MTRSKNMDRRSFMATSGAFVAGATLCSGCSLFTTQAKPDHHAVAKSGVMQLPKEAGAKLLAPGSTLRVTTPDGSSRVFLVRGKDGVLVALSMACTHWGSDVDYLKDKNQFECPSHGSRFGLDGAVLEGPAGDPLTRYAVTEGPQGISVTL